MHLPMAMILHAITISGRYIDTIRDLMQNALHTIVNWATDVGLGVNPPINISEEAKYLDLILDKKLSWKQNCHERARKATNESVTDVCILSDRQSALRALDSLHITSTSVLTLLMR